MALMGGRGPKSRTFSDHQLNLCPFIQDDAGSGKGKEADPQVQAREILQERLDLYKIDIEELELNLRRNIILGGVFYFDMLNIPPQPKKVGDWIICQGCHYTDFHLESTCTFIGSIFKIG